MAVLSLLLAEAELLSAQVGVPPLLLLDDALSELDADRRRLLSDRLGSEGRRSSPGKDRGRGAAACAGAARRVARRGARRLMERLDGSVRRALRRSGVPDAGARGATGAWPAAVGQAIARRVAAAIARDGTPT